MFKTKCGCPYCKNQPVPFSRTDWKRRTNSHGHSYGVHQKGGRTVRRTNVKALIDKMGK